MFKWIRFKFDTNTTHEVMIVTYHFQVSTQQVKDQNEGHLDSLKVFAVSAFDLCQIRGATAIRYLDLLAYSFSMTGEDFFCIHSRNF